MLDFFKLYITEDLFAGNSLGIMMVVLYANTILYMLDFYNLVKRKSQAETFAMLSIPLVVSLCGSTLAGTLLSVPMPGHLDAFVMAHVDESLSVQLLFVVAFYGILWLVTYFSQQKRLREDVRKWILSCIPDYCFAAVIIVGTAGRLALGNKIFADYGQVFLWVYLYSIFFLGCKVLLLIVGNLVRLYSRKIMIFRWREGMSPSIFLTIYFYLCQNAIARNTLLFELGILIPLTAALHMEGWTSDGVVMMMILYLGGAFVVAFSTASVRRGLRSFDNWGIDSRKMFCREYFLEIPLYKDDNFTVTRHYLVAEQNPAEVYYWPHLNYISNWVTNKDGRYKELRFCDGKACRFTPKEVEESGEVFVHAAKNLEIYRNIK